MMDVDEEVRATWGRGTGALTWQQKLVSVEGVWADGLHCVIDLWETSKRNREKRTKSTGQGRAGRAAFRKGTLWGAQTIPPAPRICRLSQAHRALT